MSFSNLKISTRQSLAFALLLLFVVLTAGIGWSAMHEVKGRMDGVTRDGMILKSATDMRGSLNEMARSSRNVLIFKEPASKAEARSIFVKAREKYAAASKLMDSQVESVEARKIRADIASSRASAEPMLVTLVEMAMSDKAEKVDEGRTYLHDVVQPAQDKWFANVGAMIALEQGLSDVAIASVDEGYKKAVSSLIIAATLAVGLGLILAWLTVHSVTSPLAEALGAANALAEGRLDSKIETGGTNETGQLLSAISRVQSQLNAFAQAQIVIAEKHEAGEISYRMDEAQFPGEYGKLAHQVNSLVQGHIAVEMKLQSVAEHYGRGDLSVDMDRLPGQQAKLSIAMDATKRNLVAINVEIQKLAESASIGDFTVRGDESRFEFEFRKMIAGLNQVMQTSDKGLSEVSRVLSALAKGDLTESVKGTYQGSFARLKDDCNQTVANLTDIVGRIHEASETIDTAAREISQGNTNLSQRTEEQASSLEETASSMEQLTATVKQNADNARQANQLAVGASDVAVKGGNVVKQVVDTMSGISESSKKIADIIGTIDGIAFQTNILALNAAVEAARAGEQGRGFAVVASEVRNLAQRSANAAKEIKELITDSVSRVDSGTALVDEAGRTMEEIVTSVKRVTDIMAEITAASQEQSSGIEQVNQAITQMDEVTQQNAALVEQAAAASESMQEQSGQLIETLSVFRLSQGNGRAFALAA